MQNNSNRDTVTEQLISRDNNPLAIVCYISQWRTALQLALSMQTSRCDIPSKKSQGVNGHTNHYDKTCNICTRIVTAIPHFKKISAQI